VLISISPLVIETTRPVPEQPPLEPLRWRRIKGKKPQRLKRRFERSRKRRKIRAGLDWAAVLLRKRDRESLTEAHKVLATLQKQKKVPAIVSGMLGYVEFLRGHAAKAASLYERYLKKSKKPAHDTTLRLWLAYHYLVTGESDRVTALFKALQGSKRNSMQEAIYLYLEAWRLFYRSRFGEALKKQKQAYAAVAAAQPTGDSAARQTAIRISLLKGLVFFYGYAKKGAAAEAYFKSTLVEADRKNLGKVLWSLLDLYFTQGRYDEVLKLAAVQSYPEVDGFAVTLALVDAHLALAQQREALALLKPLVEKKAANKAVSPRQRDTLLGLLVERAKRLHGRYTRTLITSQGKIAAEYYALALSLPNLSAKDKKRIKKFQTDLMHFQKQVRAAEQKAKTAADKASGSLTSRIMENVLGRFKFQIAHCFRRQLIENPVGANKVLLQLSISPAGAVTQVEVGATSRNENNTKLRCPPPLAHFCRCVIHRATRWRFPAYHAKHKVTRLQVPLHLENPNRAAAR
jgi:hypothetical protein